MMRTMLRRVRVIDHTNKIIAVKLVREMTSLGLREALGHVEAKSWFSADFADETLNRLVDEARRTGVTIEFDPPMDVASRSANELPIAIGIAGDYAIRYRSGPNKINAIKLTREINPNLGLKDTKDLVEGEGVIRVGVSYSEAQRIVGLFREIGSVVEVFEGNVAVTHLPPPWVPAPPSPPGQGGSSGTSARAAKPASPAHPATHVYGRPADDDDF
jgi:ribosomal protein L7/L12